jgi:hypothetical protein
MMLNLRGLNEHPSTDFEMSTDIRFTTKESKQANTGTTDLTGTTYTNPELDRVTYHEQTTTRLGNSAVDEERRLEQIPEADAV